MPPRRTRAQGPRRPDPAPGPQRRAPAPGSDLGAQALGAAASKIEEAVGAALGGLAEMFELQAELQRDYPGARVPRLSLWSNNGWLYVVREAHRPDGSGTQETVVAKYRVPVAWGEIDGIGHVGPDGEWVEDSGPVVWEVER